MDFVEGIKFYKPSSGAPDFIISNATINRDEMIEFLKKQPTEFRITVKNSKKDTHYAVIDTYSPDA